VPTRLPANATLLHHHRRPRKRELTADLVDHVQLTHVAAGRETLQRDLELHGDRVEARRREFAGLERARFERLDALLIEEAHAHRDLAHAQISDRGPLGIQTSRRVNRRITRVGVGVRLQSSSNLS